MVQESGRHYFEFGPFRLDAAEGVLTRSGQLVLLNPKAAEILVVLVRHHGRLVSKEDLMKAVWPDAFVEDANLNVQISALRKVLEDSAEAPTYIETIPRRGYRFLCEVQEVQEDPAESPIERRLAAHPTQAKETSATWDGLAGRKLTSRVLALSAMLVIAAVLTINFWPGSAQPVSGARTGRFLVGVLPFANLSGDHEQEYLADGLTDELITELARLNPKQLGVIARTSMMPYKGNPDSVAQVARALGLQYVLEGSVLRAGNRVRINVKLIQTGDQSQVWANQYDRDFKDLLEVQQDVARAVARETFVHVTPETQKRQELARAVSPQAYEAYLKGRVYWWMRTEEGYERARAYFTEALRIDPNFARAYAGLADISTVYGQRLGDPRVPARKAVALDDSLAEAHASLAFALWAMELDWVAAETHFRRALEIDPYYTTARHWYGYMLTHWGRHAEAIEQMERACETDPLNMVVLTDLGQAYFFAGQYERGKAPLRKAMEVDAKFPWPHYWLGRIYEAEGQFQEALSEFQLAADQPLSRMDRNTALACLYARMGQTEKARQLLRKLERSTNYLPRNRALVYAALGEKDRAIKVLSESSKYWTTNVGAIVDPGFATLRSDPRFQKAIASLAPPAR